MKTEEKVVTEEQNKPSKEKKNYVKSYKEFSDKRWVSCAIVLLASFVAFIALFIPFVKMNFIVTGERGTINAFQGAFANTYYQILADKIDTINIISWLHVLGFVGGIGFFIYAILKKDEKFVDLSGKIIFAALLLIAILEWNLGSELVSFVQAEGMGYVNSSSTSYIYFVLLVIVEALYFVAEKYLPADFKLSALKKFKKQSNEPESLIKYYELYQQGVITEEDYEKKKKELLK